MKIKNLVAMAMVALMTSACGSGTEEIPEVPEHEIPGGEIDKPTDKKKNPELQDVINVNNKIVDALKDKLSQGKAELSSYFDAYTYISSTFKNNKYTVQFADGTTTIIDLNNYSSGSRKAGTSRSRSLTGTRSEENSEMFSNSKVYLWEPLPEGTLIDQQVGQLLEDYIGAENIERVSGQACTWQALMGLSEHSIVILNGLGADGKWIVTGQEHTATLDYSTMKNAIGIYTAVVDGKAKHYYMVNDVFVAQYMAPLVDRGIVINAASSSADGNQLAEAFGKIGYTTYLGFDNMVPGTWAAENVSLYLSSLMEDRSTTSEAFTVMSSEYEFKLNDTNIKVSPVFTGAENLRCPYTAYTDRMAVNNLLEHYGCDESLTYETLLADGKIVLDYEKRINMLDLGNCGLEGEVSEMLQWLDQLYMLNLNDNKLSGEIPAFLGGYQKLSALMLQDNQFTGTVPASFERYYTSQGFVNLTGNNLNGQIPFGKYTDANMFFQFDHKYIYNSDGTTTTNTNGLWFSDEPIQ